MQKKNSAARRAGKTPSFTRNRELVYKSREIRANIKRGARKPCGTQRDVNGFLNGALKGISLGIPFTIKGIPKRDS